MKLKWALCMLVVIQTARSGQSIKDWSDWLSEGLALSAAGEYAEAVKAFRQALALAEASSSIGERPLVRIYDSLAAAYAESGQSAESEHQYRRALTLVEKTQGRHSLDYALLLASLAVLPQNGYSDDVAAVLREAISANQQSASTRDLAILRNCLAELLIADKRYDEAEPWLIDLQASFVSRHIEEPKLLADSLSDLGVIRFHQRRYSESVDLHRESLRILTDVPGADPLRRLVRLNNLGASYMKMGRVDEAGLAYKNAISICNQSPAGDSATCGNIFANYALVLRTMGRKQEARKLAAQAERVVRAAERRDGVGSTVGVGVLRSARH